MSKLILADGTELACDMCSQTMGLLLVNFPGESSVPAAADIMRDPAKTKRLTYHSDAGEREYYGFTVIHYLIKDGTPSGGMLCAMEIGG